MYYFRSKYVIYVYINDININENFRLLILLMAYTEYNVCHCGKNNCYSKYGARRLLPRGTEQVVPSRLVRKSPLLERNKLRPYVA